MTKTPDQRSRTPLTEIFPADERPTPFSPDPFGHELQRELDKSIRQRSFIGKKRRTSFFAHAKLHGKRF